MTEAITKMAAEMAEHINENKSPEGYTIVCSHQGLLSMVDSLTGEDAGWYETMNRLFEEMWNTHNMYLTFSQYGEVVLDERGGEF